MRCAIEVLSLLGIWPTVDHGIFALEDPLWNKWLAQKINDKAMVGLNPWNCTALLCRVLGRVRKDCWHSSENSHRLRGKNQYTVYILYHTFLPVFDACYCNCMGNWRTGKWCVLELKAKRRFQVLFSFYWQNLPRVLFPVWNSMMTRTGEQHSNPCSTM